MKKYFLYRLITLTILLISACAPTQEDDTKGLPAKEIKAGYYKAYSIQKGFDIDTGKPIYWIVACPVKMLLEDRVPIQDVKDLRFYEVPRSRIANIPDNNNVDPTYFYRGLIKVE